MNIAVPGYCPPGWRRFEESCLQIHFNRVKPWGDARIDCRNRGGWLAVFAKGFEPHKITKFIDDYEDELSYISVGAYASDGRWITVKNKPFPKNKYSSLWGPYEPSGHGWCGDLIFGEKWNNNWRGKGWRINDNSCLTLEAFVCQKTKHDSSKNLTTYCQRERELVTEIVSIILLNRSVEAVRVIIF